MFWCSRQSCAAGVNGCLWGSVQRVHSWLCSLFLLFWRTVQIQLLLTWDLDCPAVTGICYLFERCCGQQMSDKIAIAFNLFSSRIFKRWNPWPLNVIALTDLFQRLPLIVGFRTRVTVLDSNGISFFFSHLPLCQAEEITCDGNSASGRNWSDSPCFCRFRPSSMAGLDRSNTPLVLSREEISTALAMNKEGISRYFFLCSCLSSRNSLYRITCNDYRLCTLFTLSQTMIFHTFMSTDILGHK
jgi:hypothetical protein